ncbi:MAG: hypothetical protein GY875_00570 [Gammaproteobacteria bacterium]|nr:hypothetical protein [Gammaproteobacteria bacterium]
MRDIWNRGALFLHNHEPVVSWQTIFNKLNKFYALEDNWDGEGAVAPDDDTIGSAIFYFLNLYDQGGRVPTNISTSPEGVIIAEFHQDESYSEIEFSSPTEAEWMNVVDNLEPVFKQIELRPYWITTRDQLTQSVFSHAFSMGVRLDLTQRRGIDRITSTHTEDTVGLDQLESQSHCFHDYGVLSDEFFTPDQEAEDIYSTTPALAS